MLALNLPHKPPKVFGHLWLCMIEALVVLCFSHAKMFFHQALELMPVMIPIVANILPCILP